MTLTAEQIKLLLLCYSRSAGGGPKYGTAPEKENEFSLQIFYELEAANMLHTQADFYYISPKGIAYLKKNNPSLKPFHHNNPPPRLGGIA